MRSGTSTSVKSWCFSGDNEEDGRNGRFRTLLLLWR